DINVVGLLAAAVVEEAVVRAVKNSKSLHGYPGYLDVHKK
ncbi:MAG TPA: peptidase S58 family protein, partial [Clostridiales bacterium]|nr:peptidase S58 family protein [Clostridiales bacterium]